MVHGGQTLRTAPRGYIPEFTRKGGPAPSLATTGEQAHGAAHGGHIQKLTMTGGPTPSHVEDHDRVPCSRNPEPSSHGGRTHETALKGRDQGPIIAKQLIPSIDTLSADEAR